jgi:hypothetical protein
MQPILAFLENTRVKILQLMLKGNLKSRKLERQQYSDLPNSVF